jgi:glycosyltransferase involved in cell wall biosynthesis
MHHSVVEQTKLQAGPSRRLYVNGRFLGQPHTGVQRYAMEILRQWDQMLEEREIDGAHNDIVVWTPPGDGGQQPFHNIRVLPVGHLHGNLWEQIDLPRFTSGQRLFNPCNSAPWIKRDGQTVTIHDASVFAFPEAYSWQFRLKHQVLYRRLAETARRIITVSEFSKGELMRWCNIPADRIRVIYSGCEHILAQPADPSILDRFHLAGHRFVLAVGSNSAHKNLAAVLQLPNLLDDKNIHLVIAGGTYARVFQQVHYETSSNVHWLGFVSDPQLRALYEHAAVFVYPSLYEGFGFPALEAMACGCPVVLSGASSLPELGGGAAVYCDPDDARTLASGVLQILGDAKLRTRLVESGRERAREFNWRKSARLTWSALQ